MNGKSGAGAGDAVSGTKIGHSFTHSDDRSGTAVAGILRLIETAAHGLNRRIDSVATNFGDDLTNQVGTGSALFCSRLLRANSAEARSVPADTTDAAIRTSTHPGRS